MMPLSFNHITQKAQKAFNRFPVVLLWVLFGTLFCIYKTDNNTDDLFDSSYGTFLTFILGVSWLVAAQFFIEQQKNPKRWQALKFVIVLFLLLFWWSFPNTAETEAGPESVARFFIYLIAGHLFVFFAPFIQKWNKAAYWNYLKAIGKAILRSGFFSGVLYIGLLLGLLAIDALFDARIKDVRFLQLFFFCLGVVNTWIYLSDFPKNVLDNNTIQFQKALEVFVKYILIPLVLLYLAILYAYSFKILLEWELPKGWVSYLVTILAFLGFLVQVIINPIQKSIQAWTINRFYPWFYWLLLPLLVLLYVAILRRVFDYGITENRYFVLLLALWITAMCCYLLFAKNRRLIVLPISLFLMTMCCSFGFWGVFKVSKNSQVRQFEKVYTSVVANNNFGTSKELKQLKSILKYLDDRRMLSELDPITGIAMVPAFKDSTYQTDSYRSRYTWTDTRKILDSLSISLHPSEASDRENDSYTMYNYNSDYFFRGKSISLTGYDYFAPIFWYENSDTITDMGDFKLTYDKRTLSLLFSSKTDTSIRQAVSLEQKLEALTKYNSQIPEKNKHEMILDFNEGVLSGKLILTDIGYRKQQNDSIVLYRAHAYLFLKP
ncbi:DUF4153 domain-containing protein [Maribacter sp. 2-571]|uniref:DUF4153 domain-containing protein n=1 Tax=Maribacter sp. 2-571 TaxID=3417569 RepID=UPI003D35924B